MEQRIIRLEQAEREHSFLLRDIVHKTTMVLGMATIQEEDLRQVKQDVHELKQDVHEFKQEVRQDIQEVRQRVDRVENKLDQVLVLLSPKSDERLNDGKLT